jgi:hypothetical protein
VGRAEQARPTLDDQAQNAVTAVGSLTGGTVTSPTFSVL